MLSRQVFNETIIIESIRIRWIVYISISWIPDDVGIRRPHDLAELVGLADGHLVAGGEVCYLGLKLFNRNCVWRRGHARGTCGKLDLAGVLTRDLDGPSGVRPVGGVGVYKSAVNALSAPVDLIISSVRRINFGT